MSKVSNINYDDLYFLYENDCKLRNISPITIKGYEFAHKKFKDFAGNNLKCEDITQDLISEYILHLKDNLKPQTVNSYIFKISPVIKYGEEINYKIKKYRDS
ncbi:phage integrase SAM-like domain-containing protein [Anaerosalibacter massiliensis]|uniref:phage integrase SAM-like domain-containing protein n=1 Tax=Anaerosalibacter massiliensis TaxID=1347392 RepID=UPI0009E02728